MPTAHHCCAPQQGEVACRLDRRLLVRRQHGVLLAARVCSRVGALGACRWLAISHLKRHKGLPIRMVLAVGGQAGLNVGLAVWRLGSRLNHLGAFTQGVRLTACLDDRQQLAGVCGSAEALVF